MDRQPIQQPDYKDFCQLVYETVDAYVPWNRVTIQSFDPRVLQYFHKQYPNVRLAMLEEHEPDAEKAISSLGFNPAIYSPTYRFLKTNTVKWLHENGIQVIPWTVNDVDEMKKLIEMGVDGIITDFPNLIPEVSN